jgi:hypothetical protein
MAESPFLDDYTEDAYLMPNGADLTLAGAAR